MVNWCIALVTAIVAAVFGVPAAAAASPANPAVVSYVGDVHHHSALTYTYTGTERCPPASYDLSTRPAAVDCGVHGASVRPEGATSACTTTYTTPARLVVVARATGTTAARTQADWGPLSSLGRNDVAANTGEKLLWTSWQNYPKVMQGGREYAQIGERLYTRHAVDRLQPSGLGAPAGATGAGRSISPNFVEDALGSTKGAPVKGPNGEARLSFTSGTVQVITENNIVITVITR